MAQAYALLGSKVTVLLRSDKILPKEDRDAAKIVNKSLVEDGIEFLYNLSMNEVRYKSESDNKIYEILCTRKGENGTTEEINVEADALLVATGRAPNVDGLELENAQVKYDNRKGVQIDSEMKTSNPNIYAVGDVTIAPQFTHLFGTMGGMVVDNALLNGNLKWDTMLVPRVTYTEPEVATVSLPEWENNNTEVDEYVAGLEHNDRGILNSNNIGFVKILCKKDTDCIVSATIVAENAGEMISELTLAIQFDIGLGSRGLGSVIHSYPTVAEAIGGCAFQYKMKHWPTRDTI